MTVLPRRRGIVRGLRALGPHVLPRGATGSVVARPWPGCPRPSGATQAMVATHGRPGPYRAPQRQCRPSGGVPGGPGGPVPGVGYRPPGGSREAPEGPRGASWAGFSGPEKGQKMAFFWTLRCKVQGEWGGSAHSPDPTAQSASQNAAAARAHGGPGRAVRGGCGGCLWGGGCMLCVASGGVAARGRREQGLVLAEREGSPPGDDKRPLRRRVGLRHPPLPCLLGDP